MKIYSNSASQTNNNIGGTSRIAVLDGFRFLAISLVVLFHYFTLFIPPFTKTYFYPYHDKYAHISLFRYGYLGVHFFFMISGFVIFMTLKKCVSYKVFLVKRFTRLWPALMVCSIITFFFVNFIDWKNEFGFHSLPQYFLPSLTFSEPRLWTKLLHFKTMDYIDGVYWSLICEVKFYLIVGILYFADKVNFFRNWLIYAFMMLFCYILILHSGAFISIQAGQNIQYYFRLTLFPQYLMFFTWGIYFFMVFNGDDIKKSLKITMLLMSIAQLYFLQSNTEDIFIGIFILLFLTFLYKRNWLNFLSNRYVSLIGVISYPIYLLHEKIGIILITKFGVFFGRDLSVLAVIPTTVIVVLLSYLVYKTIEIPANSFLKRLILGPETKTLKHQPNK